MGLRLAQGRLPGLLPLSAWIAALNRSRSASNSTTMASAFTSPPFPFWFERTNETKTGAVHHVPVSTPLRRIARWYARRRVRARLTAQTVALGRGGFLRDLF